MNAALVLAGGFATRFDGGDKAVADVAGRPMIARVVEAVGPVVDEVVVNARRDQQIALDAALADVDVSVRYAFDTVEDAGPLSGIATGLEVIDAAYTLVVACDMPFVDARFVESLFDRAIGRDGAVPIERTESDAWPQPLQAVYETETLQQAAEDALERDVTSPLTVIKELDLDEVDVGAFPNEAVRWSLRNVNTQRELREAERRFAATVDPTDD